MPTRSHVLAALAAGAAVLAVPAAASAAAPSIIAGPVKVKAYTMTVSASGGSLSVSLFRQAGKSTQFHYYSAAQGVTTKIARNLGSGSVKASLGKYGNVKLKLHASGPLRKAQVPKGCTGKPGHSRAGTLTGTFKLKADNGRYFGTIKEKSLRAQVIRGGTLKCQAPGGGGNPGGGSPHSTILSRSIAGANEEFTSFTVSRTNGKVFESVTRTESATATAPLSILHSINAPAPSGAFDVASDLSTAKVQGAGKFITGSLDFKADNVFGETASGTGTGDLTAKFDPLGKVSLIAGDAPTTLFQG